MTVFIGWVDANVGGSPQKRGFPGVAAGGLERGFCQSWTKKTTDVDGSLYFIEQIPSNAILTKMEFNMDAITGLTSASFGIFEIDPSITNMGGPVQSVAAGGYYAGSPTSGVPSPSNPKVDASAILMALTDVHNGYAVGSELNAMSAISVQTITSLGATTYGFLNFGIKVWQLLGFTDPKWKSDSYAIGMYMATAGTAAGNLLLRGRWIQG